MLTIWATRLGIFLFYRVLNVGEDWRFKNVKSKFGVFFIYWTMQGLWICIVGSPVWLVLFNKQADDNGNLGPLEITGFVFFFLGFFLETLSDYQKFMFKQEPKNKNQLMMYGIFALSRHPNYFGEVLLQTGIWIAAFRSLIGLQYLTIISPLFTFILLRYISGVPILERSHQKRFGSDPNYILYKKNTPIFFPKFF
eukprot:TRINITY_DN1009_c0_g1_i2.p1 TRINITY_DN1009_c0_g1~~TRINITY_DN1009_c0_g1_i2.p1  ORF type:complete len:196 (-),score=29.56 TRINITY_DN1009_c0_g1_i2:14-601(-)